jgi:hypothetical protein
MLSSSFDHITFSVWPENASNNFDIMSMHVDGHFRPKEEGSSWGRIDIHAPESIPSVCRILDMSQERDQPKSVDWEEFYEKGKGKGKGKCKGKQQQQSVVSMKSVVASRATEPDVINTAWSTIHGGGGLLETVHLAYNFDKDLMITPDDVFLTILAGVNTHIAKDPEKYRHVFVPFEGKQTIEIESDSTPDLWEAEGVFEQFAEAVRKHVGETWHDATTCDFSTTTPLEKFLSQLGLMNATSHYFHFEVAAMCGIKSVTLKGTEDDWIKLRQKVEAFAVLGDLDWWLQDLRLVLDQFVLARQGFISPSFWRRMIKGEHADTGVYERWAYKAYVTGWVLAFYPYTKEGKRFCATTFSEQKAWQRPFDEFGTCTECGKAQTSGEMARGKFCCSDCWRGYDLMKHWGNVWVEQPDLHDGLLTASIAWHVGAKKVGDVRIHGGVVGPSVPSDNFAPLRTVRGYVMELDQSADIDGSGNEKFKSHVDLAA